MTESVDIEVGKKEIKNRIPSNTTVNTAADLGEKKVTFADVVRTTTIIKKWLLSVQHEDEGYQDDQMSEINTSLVFEPAGLSRTPSRATSLMNSIADLSELNSDQEQPISETNEAVAAEATTPRLNTEIKANGDTLQPPEIIASSLPELTFVEKWKQKLIDFLIFLKDLPLAPVNPSKSFYYYWSFVIYVAFLYNAFMSVIFIFDNTDGPFFIFWLTGNFFFDFIYFIDIYINLKLIYMEDGLYVTSFKKRALKYLKTYGFAFDIISILPSDLFLLLNRRLSVIRVNRLFKLNRVIDFVNKQNIKTNFPNGFRIFHIFVACMTLFHWNCSAYYTISLFTGTNSTYFNAWEFNYVKIADPIITTCDNWLNDMDENCRYSGELPIDPNDTDTIEPMMNYWSSKSEKLLVSNFTKQYMLSIYWSSLTLTTSGQQPYPTLSSHILLEVFDTIVGMLIFAVIVGSVGNVVATMNKDKTEFQNLMDGLKFYMDYRHVQPVVQKRVKDVVAYNQKYGMIKDEANIMAGLPQRLKGELAVHLHMENLKRVKLLRDMDPSLLYELVLKMEMQMFAPNDMLCRKGELAREMFIVKRGTLELLAETGKVVNQLKEGASFGELAILKISGGKSANRRSRSLRSVGYSDVYVLKREDALAVLQDYPDQRNKLIEKAKQMIRQQTDMFQEFEGFDEDLHEISGTQNTDETLVTLSKSITTIEEEISNMYQEFLQNSTEMKQRVTQLEKMYFRNHRRIRQYNAQRMANQLTNQPRSP